MHDILPNPRGLFENLRREHSFEPVKVEGRIPKALRGTLYRNGPGILELFGERCSHLFEGDGMISALRFGDDGVSAAARVIQSAGLVAERQAGRRLGAGKNTANTHVVPWQGGLYALMEGGLPTALDPKTLDTLGETNLGGVVQQMFSAHPHRVAARRCLYNFGMSYGPRTTIDLYALPDAGSACLMGQIPLEHPVMLHDFIATERHLVFFVSPLHLSIEKIMMQAPFADCFVWTPEAGTEVIVVPIDDPDKPVRFKVDPFFQFHFAAAYDDGDEIVVDYVHYGNGDLLGSLGDGADISFRDHQRHVGGKLHRARLNPTARTFKTTPRWDTFCEFPRTAEHTSGSPHQHTWVQSERWQDGVLRFGVSRIDHQGHVQEHVLPPGHHASEPVLAQNPTGAETDGSALVLVYDSVKDCSHVLIFDAETLDVQARVQLTQPIPIRFHGSWMPSAS